MRLLITFGPSYEPLDGARRLTNMSTGRLGTELANAFWAAGWHVHCLRGEGSSFLGPLHVRDLETFTTNDDLAGRLERLSRVEPFDVVLHAAALCDYRVSRVFGADGQEIISPKIASRDGRLTLELEPATKLLPKLRSWFATARLVGWKYELAGTQSEALEKAWRQMRENRTDACVLNGAAYGPGFAVCREGGTVSACRDSAELAECLLEWLAGRHVSAC
jgi:phosphopantothenoylcysteine synthetase/decarboxylase